jgi:hypothetical protein
VCLDDRLHRSRIRHSTLRDERGVHQRVSKQFALRFKRTLTRGDTAQSAMSRIALGAFVVSFLVLMYLGLQPAEGVYVVLARIFTAIYFAYFIPACMSRGGRYTGDRHSTIGAQSSHSASD